MGVDRPCGICFSGVWPPAPLILVSMQISQAAAKDAAREFAQLDRWIPWAEQGVRVVVILAAAWLPPRMVRRLLNGLRVHALHQMERHRDRPQIEVEKRAATIVAT